MAEFYLRFSDNILKLHNELKTGTYQHGNYQAFKINDPKPRDIHKASVRDRLVHHAIYRILYPYFDRKFIFDSYSCRINKGTHRAINRFREFSRKISKNNTKQCWVLQCDIKKFFANIDHKILKNILDKHIGDEKVLWLFLQVIDSFGSNQTRFAPTPSNIPLCKEEGKTGLPLGNLTSQLLVNIYMNEFDHFIKRELKIKYYIRYADDFVVLSENKKCLEKLISKISEFLGGKLKLSLHPNKVFIQTLNSGVDFLGWINFSDHRVLRTHTKRRMFKKLSKSYNPETMISYLGLISHGNTHKIRLEIDKKLK